MATSQLAEVYARHVDTDIRSFADRIGMDERDLKKVVLTQNYAFTGLKVADEICMGFGYSISDLVRLGELTIVPAHERWRSAERMAADEVWLAEVSEWPDEDTGEMLPMPVPTPEEVEARVQELKKLRATLCAETEHQRARLDSDAQRARDSRQKKVG